MVGGTNLGGRSRGKITTSNSTSLSGGKLNIFQLFQQWVKGLDRSARTGKTDKQRRWVPGNAPSTAASPTGAKNVSLGKGEVKSYLLRDTRVTAVTSLRWLKYGETAVVAGRDIGGMVYLGPGKNHRDFGTEGKPIIFPTLPVAWSSPDVFGDGMPYWPRYSEISPDARAAYLDWLATGRSDRRYGVGHVFLYFYGSNAAFSLTHPILTSDASSSKRSIGCSKSMGTTDPFVDTSKFFLMQLGLRWRQTQNCRPTR